MFSRLFRFCSFKKILENSLQRHGHRLPFFIGILFEALIYHAVDVVVDVPTTFFFRGKVIPPVFEEIRTNYTSFLIQLILNLIQTLKISVLSSENLFHDFQRGKADICELRLRKDVLYILEIREVGFRIGI